MTAILPWLGILVSCLVGMTILNQKQSYLKQQSYLKHTQDFWIDELRRRDEELFLLRDDYKYLRNRLVGSQSSVPSIQKKIPKAVDYSDPQRSISIR